MKQVLLSSSEQRLWRTNVTKVVNVASEGAVPTVLRDVSPEEEAALYRLRKQAAQRKESVSESSISPKATASTVRAEVSVVEFDGNRRPKSIAINTTIDGMPTMNVRELMSIDLLHKHGECMLKGVNGKFVRTLRDPSLSRPTAGTSTAPKPDNCICVSWGNPHPGRHHPVCQYNETAPLEERALTEEVESVLHVSVPAKTAVTPEPEHEVAVKAEPPPPEKCICNGFMPDGIKNPTGSAWPRPDTLLEPDPQNPKRHHPMCEHHDAWEELNGSSETFLLLDTESGEVVRHATSEEVATSKELIAKGDMPIVTVGDAVYLVQSPESETETADTEPPAESNDAA